LTPNPAIKNPAAAIQKLTALAIIIAPIEQINQDKHIEGFLPQLSARKEKIKKPTKEPI